MRRYLFIVIALFVTVLNCSCSQEKNLKESGKNIASMEASTQISDSLVCFFSFEIEPWINNRLNNSDFTQSQKDCLREAAQTIFERLSTYVRSSLVKRFQWKALHNYEQWTYFSFRRTLAKKIKFLDRLEYESLFNELNDRLLEGDVSFKSCEILFNDLIFRFNDSHEGEILQTVSLPRVPKKSIINSELVRNLYIYLDENFSDLKRKEKKNVELSLLVSAISKQYADVFDDNNLFAQTK